MPPSPFVGSSAGCEELQAVDHATANAKVSSAAAIQRPRVVRARWTKRIAIPSLRQTRVVRTASKPGTMMHGPGLALRATNLPGRRGFILDQTTQHLRSANFFANGTSVRVPSRSLGVGGGTGAG